MDLNQALTEYEQIKKKMDAYQYAISLANFDLATIAPKKGMSFASKAIGELTGELFEIKVSSKMRSVIEVFERNEDNLTSIKLREMELLKEDIEQLEKIPKDEYMEYAQLQSMSQFIWEEAKETCDFDLFLPYLEKLVTFTRRFAKLTKPQMSIYNACLDDYEKGLTTKELDIFFAEIRKKTVPLLHKIISEGKEIRNDFNDNSYSIEKQKTLSYKILELIGFDKDAGILAVSAHPFTSEINDGDVRLTTHFYENDLSSALTSTMHEGGHGLYEQKSRISPIIKDSTLVGGISMGIHESQSRFYENMIFRSREFCDYFFPFIKAEFPVELADVTAKEFYEAINIAKPKLIRIEADELTYNLHIMIRYELEKELLEGTIEAKNLPTLWSQKYEDYLGIRPSNVAEGVLQDIHWSGGMFGYFPSYALGNAYAAQMKHTMTKSLNIKELCKAGNLQPIGDWLNENVHQYGRLKKPNQLIMDITGESLNPTYLTNYLEEKYSSIYFGEYSRTP